MRRATQATHLLVRATVAEAFLPRASTFGRVVAVRGSAEDDDALLQSAGWPGVKDILNQLPTFCVANAEGQPLQYEADGKPLAMFYTCVDAAKAELADAKKEYPDLDLDIIPMGLGEAFRLARSGAAVLVPSVRSLLAAGAPPTATPVGQEVPLFCCMEMSQEGPDGGAILPMFMEESECRDAVADVCDVWYSRYEDMVFSIPRPTDVSSPETADLGRARAGVGRALRRLLRRRRGEAAGAAPGLSLIHI